MLNFCGLPPSFHEKCYFSVDYYPGAILFRKKLYWCGPVDPGARAPGGARLLHGKIHPLYLQHWYLMLNFALFDDPPAAGGSGSTPLACALNSNMHISRSKSSPFILRSGPQDLIAVGWDHSYPGYHRKQLRHKKLIPKNNYYTEADMKLGIAGGINLTDKKSFNAVNDFRVSHMFLIL
jgi:hypothetical protein